MGKKKRSVLCTFWVWQSLKFPSDRKVLIYKCTTSCDTHTMLLNSLNQSWSVGQKTVKKNNRLITQNRCVYLNAPGTENAVLGRKLYSDDVENPHSLHFDHLKNTIWLLMRIKVCLLAQFLRG